VPEPEGFSSEAVRPDAVRYDPRLKEFILPYEAVRTAPDPAQSILELAQTTYEAAARLAGWNIASLNYP
jgi:hypothetical protein